MTRIWRRLAMHQTRRPWLFVAVFASLTGVGAWRASRLSLVTDFADLLSQDQPSVIELRRILAHTRGLSTVYVVIEGSHPARLREVADALIPPLRAIGGPFVESARSGLQEASRFLKPRAGLFLTEGDLTALERNVARESRRAFRRAIGADLGEEPDPDDAATRDGNGRASGLAARAIEGPLLGKVGALDRYPDGYFQAASSATGWAQVIEIKAAVTAGDIAGTEATLARVRTVVSETLARFQGAGANALRVGYAGDLLTSAAEYDLVRRDVLHVGVLGAVLVLGVVLLFFRTPRALVALGGAVGAGAAMTFGLSERFLGHLNVATGFLFSIVIGNGVNFGIIWLARFVDERRAGRTLARAVALALERSSGATLAAACAASAAYAALGVGRFRGFRHFAFIGGCGMLLCWLTSYGLLPPLVVLLERGRRSHRQLGLAPGRTGSRWRLGASAPARFDRPFAWLATRAPGAALAASLLLGATALVLATAYLSRGALEYDMRHLQSDRGSSTQELYRVSDLVNRVLGTGEVGGMVVLTEDARETPILAQALRHIRDVAPKGLRPFEDVHTLDDLVPPDQAARLPRLRALTRHLIQAHDRGGIDEAAWSRIEPLLPPADLAPFTVDDLPAALVEPFTEKDGRRGRILYIQQTSGESDSNLHYLLRFADAFRSTRLPDGRVVRGSGRAVIFADLLRASLVDMPRSVLLSLAVTALTVIALFRRVRPVAMVLGSLLLALLWMLGAMAATDVRLSFINFIALPVSFGIGIDYAVNVYGRFQQDRAAGMPAAIRGVGGAVILCSLTTSLGYVALLRSHNEAVRSLGAVAVLGEVSCLIAALVSLPAAVVWSERSRRSRSPPELRDTGSDGPRPERG